ncbi:hypothetical protein DLAC_06129 [Tieghemostelium lacteum]|uniref:DNA/RNA-binding protein Alba-like domain-containing protein n=1 Tax=Tieghemostelium lacteum TaxID=361077 RepID=A0A151ZHH6_TIELA|nr:hypothetical protein DLAC_06129 [Tieghemostelium lacteum]|eukprot:KYQ93438.1 hypothetical protein DLAC_06129 [Tieghemostelium lacteum]
MKMSNTNNNSADVTVINNTKKIKISSDVSKSLFYFSDLTARFLESEEFVDISGLGKAVSKVITTIDHLSSKNVVNVVKVHTGINSNVELVVRVSKGSGHSEYLKSMEERKSRNPTTNE